MTSMSALFVLGGLALFIAGRRRLPSAAGRAWSLMIAGIAGGTLLGAACKENAVLLPAFALLVEIYFFSRGDLLPAARRQLAWLYAITVLVPIAVGVVLVVVHPEAITSDYAIRQFTLPERLLTEGRALFFYLGLIFVPYLRAFSLYHGDFVTSTGFFSPATTALSLVAWMALLGAALATLRRRPMWSFAIAWFLVGHAIESSVIALELVHEHRNYLPSFGILFGTAWYLCRWLDRGGAPRRWWPALAAVLAVLSFVTFARARIWSDGATLAWFTARNHPAESRALGQLAASEIAHGDDVRAIYRTLRAAAAADRTTVYQLVEMAKIVAGLEQLRQRNPEFVASGRAADRAGSLFTNELRFDRAWLRRTGTALQAEIERRLRRYPLTGETAGSLIALQMCARANVDVCTPLLDVVLRWHLIALENPRTQPQNRAWLALSAAKIYGFLGETRLAIDYTRRAMKFDPKNPAFPLQMLSLQIILGNLDAARTLLTDLEQRPDLGALWKQHLAVNRRNLARAALARSAPAAAARPTAVGGGAR